MTKKIFLVIGALVVSLAAMPLFAAFEAHVVNVTAEIENALFVHPQSLEYGTVFPQEYLLSRFFVTFSESFSERDQRRVGTVEYLVKQKPQCVDPNGNLEQVEEDQNGNFICPDGTTMRPLLCPYLSKEPDHDPGGEDDNDTGVPPFHDPFDPANYAHGKLIKFDENGSTLNNDPSDTWTVDFAVPCFRGECSQDWDEFVLNLNPNAGDPDQWQADPDDEGQTFGCDLWLEVSDIY